MSNEFNLQAAPAVLSVDDLTAGYGKRMIIRNVTFDVLERGMAAVLGHNGAGKSTLLKAIVGQIQNGGGHVHLDGGDITHRTTSECVRAGLAMVPEKGRLFRTMTVERNLRLGGYTLPDPAAVDEGLEECLDLFPQLKARLSQTAGTLSGGERQMVALCRALMMRPRVVLLEEPFLGLAPPIIEIVMTAIERVNRERNQCFLMVEHNVAILRYVDVAYVMKLGEIVIAEHDPESLLNDDRLEQAYIG